MKNKKDREPIRFCGGKKKGSCNTWAGATVLKTKIKFRS